MDTATPSVITVEANCPTMSTCFFGRRSASTPPNNDRAIMGTAFARATVPSSVTLSVSSNTNQERAIICMFIAPI